VQIRLGATEWVVKRRFRRFLVLAEELSDVMKGERAQTAPPPPSPPLHLDHHSKPIINHIHIPN
jgi:hypothetical protein